MRRLKLLFITRDFTKYVERNTHYLINELAKITNLSVWHEAGNIHNILKQMPTEPDFILLNDLKESRCPEISGLSTLNCPFGIIMHDLHYKVEKRKKFIEDNDVQHIFSIYRDPFLRKYPKYQDRLHWLPHFFNPEIFTDYGLPKAIDWLLMGEVAYYYPLREKIVEQLSTRPEFVWHQHPGYRNINDGEKVFVGVDYAKEINRSKIFLTCDSILHYPIIKYYEVLACNTLLLAPCPKELLDLGFIPGKHFVEINEHNFLEKAEYYLTHEEERKKIAEQGYNMVHQNHTTQIRASQLVEMIQTILAS